MSRWSLAPCAPRRCRSPACAGSISAPPDPKGGAVEHGVRFFAAPTCHHRPEVYGGINESESAVLLRDFFAARR